MSLVDLVINISCTTVYCHTGSATLLVAVARSAGQTQRSLLSSTRVIECTAAATTTTTTQRVAVFVVVLVVVTLHLHAA